MHKTKCAFINFNSRAAAELAVEKSYNNCTINDHHIKVQWGKSKTHGPKSEKASTTTAPSVQVNQDQNTQTPQVIDYSHYSYSDLSQIMPPPPPGAQPIVYPSQDPTYFGQVPINSHKKKQNKSK